MMLTPFTREGEIDFEALGALTEWYLECGVSGLFAVTQSSEMFHLSREESVRLSEFVVKRAAGRVPVIASGHVAEDMEAQAETVKRIAQTGVDAVILITNRLAAREESDEIWIGNMEILLNKLPADIRLGLYECPYPYKRVLSPEMTRWCAETGRFYFLKDTSCDMESIRRKLEICRGTNLKLYNANTATLLESLREGAAGYSGVMGNMQCRLYVELCRRYEQEHMEELAEVLTICALIEKQLYPANAKYYLQLEGLPLTTKCRVQDDRGLTETMKAEVRMLRNLTDRLDRQYILERRVPWQIRA